MNLIWLALALLALACAVDAHSTIDLVRRGGWESWSAWIIGKHPTPGKVWAWVLVVPVVAGALVLFYLPTWWMALVIAALWRMFVARKNNKL